MITNFRDIALKAKQSLELEGKCLAYLDRFQQISGVYSTSLSQLSAEIGESHLFLDAPATTRSSRGTSRDPIEFPEVPPVLRKLRTFFHDLSITVQTPFQFFLGSCTQLRYKVAEGRQSVESMEAQIQQKIKMMKRQQMELMAENEGLQKKLFEETFEQLDCQLFGAKTSLLVSKDSQKKSTKGLRESLEGRLKAGHHELENSIETAIEQVFTIESSIRKSIEKHFCKFLEQSHSNCTEFYQRYTKACLKMTLRTPDFVLSPEKAMKASNSSSFLDDSSVYSNYSQNQAKIRANEDKKRPNCESVEVKSNTTQGRNLKENRQAVLGMLSETGIGMIGKENSYKSPPAKNTGKPPINDTPIPKRLSKDLGYELLKN